MMGMGDTVRRTHLAAFLIGGVMGVMAEMAAGLILYEGSGLLRATTVVLTTEAAAAGAGLLFATRVPVDEISRHLRRHLHLTLVALGLAGILTSLWGYLGGLSEVQGGQAAALALLAALPLYMSAAVLGLVCRAGSRDAEGGTVAGGGPALLGAAAGFLIYGLFLIPRLEPPVLVLLCMAAVSGAALLVGSAVTRAADLAHGKEDGTDPDAAAGEEDAPAAAVAPQLSHEPETPQTMEDPETIHASEAAEVFRASHVPEAIHASEDGETLRAPEQSETSQKPLMRAILEEPETSGPSQTQDRHQPLEQAGNPES